MEGLDRIVGFAIVYLDSNGQEIEMGLADIYGTMEVLLTDSEGKELHHGSSKERELRGGMWAIPYSQLNFKDRDLGSVALTVIIHFEGKSDFQASIPIDINVSAIDPDQL